VSSTRRIVAIGLFTGIFLLRIDRQLLTLPFIDRSALSEAFTERADRLWPQFPRFLAGVRERTANGDSIAIVVPNFDWDQGYSYAYYRSSYLLAGRIVLPVAMDDHKLHPENFRAAKYIAVWGRPFPPSRRAVVWTGEGGTLLRQ
jgi:hypothetical protein